VLIATYGWMKNEKHIIDVTEKIREIIEKQGGCLVLNAGPKKAIFGKPTKHKNRQLLIKYSVNGVVKTKTYQEKDAISLDVNS